MKKFLSLILLVLLFGCVGNSAGKNPDQNLPQSDAVGKNSNGVPSMENVVEKGDNVKVDYTGTFDNNEQFDSSIGREPLEFEAGAGQMIKGFDAAVLGMKLNAEKKIRLEAKDAYGEAKKELIVAIPIIQLQNSGIEPQKGMTVYTSSGQPVKITDMNKDTVWVDLNNPMAGKALNFWIKIVAIEKKKK